MSKWAKDVQPKVLDGSILASYRLQGLNADVSGVNQFESHGTYEIFIFEEGQCNYFIHDTMYDLQPGDIILLDRFTLHKTNTVSPDTYVRSAVHFSPAWLGRIFPVLGMPNLLDPFHNLDNGILRTGFNASGQYVAEKIKWIAKQLKKIDQEYQSTGKINSILETELKIEFLQLLMRIYKMSQCPQMHVEQKKTERKQHAENIVSWINQHYCEKISLERIAKEFNLNKYYVSHVFKEVTGYTVMQYVMECRLIQVKYLLEMKLDQSLEEIFRSTGFASAAHFSRFFKERIGMTPTSYRKLKGRNIYG